MISTVRAKFISLILLVFASLLSLYFFDSFITQEVGSGVSQVSSASDAVNRQLLGHAVPSQMHVEILQVLTTFPNSQELKESTKKFQEQKAAFNTYYRENLDKSTISLAAKKKLEKSKVVYDNYILQGEKILASASAFTPQSATSSSSPAAPSSSPSLAAAPALLPNSGNDANSSPNTPNAGPTAKDPGIAAQPIPALALTPSLPKNLSVEDFAKAVEDLNAQYKEFQKNSSLLDKENSLINIILQDEIKTIKTRALDRQKELAALNLSFLIIISIFIISLAVFIAVDVARKISHLQTVIKKIEGGDYTAKSTIKEKDELQSIGLSLNSMGDKILSYSENEKSSAQLAQKARQAALDENEKLNNSIIELLETVHAMSKKDLTVAAQITQDVVGTIASAVNLMASSTRFAIKEAAEISRHTEAAALDSQEQSLKMLEFNKDAEQAGSLAAHSIDESLLEMKNIYSIVTKANEAARVTTSASSKALDNVNQTQESILSIKDVVTSTEEKIKSLGEHAQEIGSIVSLINSISEKTHILALNANMQAAQAGDAGRGFGVVAQEIQKLADQTRSATEKISSIVSNIQQKSSMAISIVNTSIDNVSAGIKNSAISSQQTQLAMDSTQELAGFVTELLQAINRQENLSLNLKDKASSLREVNSLLIESATEQLMRARSLVAFSKKLNDTVSEFKVEKPDSAPPQSTSPTLNSVATNASSSSVFAHNEPLSLIPRSGPAITPIVTNL